MFKNLMTAAIVLALGGCSSSATTAPADAGAAADASGDIHKDVPTRQFGCPGDQRLAMPEDPEQGGPWPVGARTVTIGGLRTEIWYPAVLGSQAGKTAVQYDVRDHLAAEDAAKIPDSDNPWQACNCFRDLPPDLVNGPWPVVYFLHGTAGFRTQSLTQMTHWASRGFVVVAADHPHLEMKDVLAFDFGADQAADAVTLMEETTRTTGAFGFLQGRLALDRRAVAGHSAGAMALADLGAQPGVQVLIPMAGAGTSAQANLKSTLIVGGQNDSIVPIAKQKEGYATSPDRKRMIGLDKAGHLAFSDICNLGKEQGGILDIATAHGIDVNPLIAKLAKNGCEPDALPIATGHAVLNAVTSAVLEETLLCDAPSAQLFANLPGRFAAVTLFEQTTPTGK